MCRLGQRINYILMFSIFRYHFILWYHGFDIFRWTIGSRWVLSVWWVSWIDAFYCFDCFADFLLCALLPKDWCLAMIWCFVNGQFVTMFFSFLFFTEAQILGPFSCLNWFSFFSLWKILKLLKWMVCCPPVHSWPKPRLVLCQRTNFHRVFLASQDTHKVMLLS